jgi:NADPH:quinone reductase-like Zn-dependent oxidoreductase
MQAVYYDTYGDPSVLRYGEFVDPKVGPESVLIRAQAASVNPVDWKIMAGYLDAAIYTDFPIVPGWDVAGTVEAVGPAVEEFAPGDAVYGYVRMDLVKMGTFATVVSAPVRTIAKAPTTLSPTEAASVPLAGLTAYQALVHKLNVGTDDTVLINSGAGGVGIFAIQIAKHRGARVLAVGSPANHDFLVGLGAEPVPYGDDFDSALTALAPSGVDVLFDLRGGDDLDGSLRHLRSGGRISSIADRRVVDMKGHYVFVRPDQADLDALRSLIDGGALTTHVSSRYPLAQAAEAFQESMAGHARGKIAIEIAER